MSKQKRLFAVAAVMGISAVLGAIHFSSQGIPGKWAEIDQLPAMFPDYCETVLPPNIAPLNFKVGESGVDYRVCISGKRGGEIVIDSREPGIVIPPKAWRGLLQKNRGGEINLDVYVKGKTGGWSHFKTVTNAVAEEPIDSHLVYRLLGSVCNMYDKIGLYQRNLESYDESPIIENHKSGGCLNCHSFCNNSPDLFSFHVRPGLDVHQVPAAMICVRDGHAEQLKTKSEVAPGPPGYISWRTDGKAVAFALGMPRQVFRSYGPEIRDVYDAKSNLAIADTKTGHASTTPALSLPDHLETFPNWSPDGKMLYYSSAKTLWDEQRKMDADALCHTMFDLMRIPYDIETDTWGEPEVVLSSEVTGKTILEPRCSPDGRYLLFCMSDYGGFPINQAACDLYMMELANGEYRRLECNSEQTESWHSWSSNSRWIVFSSKRDNGLLARPYISYIDAEGRERKPFLLPQKDPAFYETWLRTYNLPELITGPVQVDQEELLNAFGYESKMGVTPIKSWKQLEKSAY